MKKPFTRKLLWVCAFCLSFLSSPVSYASDTCKITYFPHTEDFSVSYSPYTLPACWERVTNSTFTPKYPFCESSTQTAKFGSRQGNYSIGVLPEIESSILMSTLSIRYDAKSSAPTSGQFTIGVMSDPLDAATFIPVDTVKFSASNTWKTYTTYFLHYTGGGHYIAFKLENSTSSLDFVYLDNIKIEYAPDCAPVTEVAASQITDSSAVISWSASFHNPGTYTVEYKPSGTPTWESRTSGQTSLRLNNLLEGTRYIVRIKGNCSLAPSDFVELFFSTPCNFYTGDSIGNEKLSTNGLLPVTDKYSYSQQIFTADEFPLPSYTVTAIAFQYFHSSDMNRQIDVYLGHTQKNQFDNHTDWIPAEELTRVFQGSVHFTGNVENNWVIIPLDTHFYYNGYDNLVLAIDDNSGSILTASTPRFYTHSTPDYKSIYARANNIDPANPPTNAVAGDYQNILAYRSNVKFFECGQIICRKPDTLTFSDITSSSATLNWDPIRNGSHYEIQYRAIDDEEWIQGNTVADTFSIILNLDFGRSYLARVRTVCSNEGESDWVSGIFSTSCDSISTYPYRQNFDTYSVQQYPRCWQRNSDGIGFPFVDRNNSTGAVSQPHVLNLGTSGNGYNLIILPAVQDYTQITQLQLNFWGKTPSTAKGKLIVGVMTNPQDESTFTGIDTIFMAESNAWEAFEIPFGPYTGNGHYIAFLWKNSQDNPFFIDNIYLDYASGCIKPARIVIDSIGAHETKISWTERGTATEWIVTYASATNPAIRITDTVSFQSVTLLNLIENTTYEVYVKSYCGGTETSDSLKAVITTTCDKIYFTDLPYTESFDNYGSATHVPCWTTETTYSGTSPRISTAQYVSSPASLRLNSGIVPAGYSYTRAAIKEMDDEIPFTKLRIQFKMRSSIAGTGFQVGVMSDPTDNASFTVIRNLQNSATGTWEEMTVLLNNYEGDGRYIAFRMAEGGSFMDIDDIVIDLPECPEVTQIRVTDIDYTSARIEWNDEVNASKWLIEYGSAGFDPGSGTLDATEDHFYEFSDLTEGTRYDFYISVVCGNGDTSSLSPLHQLQTRCYAVQIPYEEDFDSFTGESHDAPGVLPACWYSTTNNMYYPAPHISTASPVVTAKSAPNALTMTNNKSGAKSYAVLPEFDYPIDTLTLSFWASMDNIVNGELYLGYVNRQDDTAAFQMITRIPNRLQMTSHTIHFQDYSIPESAKHIVFYWKNTAIINMTCSIDNISVRLFAPDTCPRPTGITAGAITDSSAVINWNVVADESEWILEYKILGSSDAYTIHSCAAPMDTLHGLTADTTYMVRIKTYCNEDLQSEYDSIVFRTPAPERCIAPSRLQIDSITVESAYISWVPEGEEVSWILEYKTENDNEYTAVTCTEPSYILTELEDSVTVYVCVKAICGQDEWSVTVCDTFKTLKVFTISATAEEHLTITPSGTIKVTRGSSHTFSIEADPGYSIGTVFVDGNDMGNISSYTFQNIQNDHTIHVTLPSSLRNIALEQSVSVYPNPAQSVIYINMSASFETVEIIDIMGRIHSSDIVSDSIMKIDVSSLGNGIYFIRLNGKEGSVNKKMIKK